MDGREAVQVERRDLLIIVGHSTKKGTVPNNVTCLTTRDMKFSCRWKLSLLLCGIGFRHSIISEKLYIPECTESHSRILYVDL
jgi:hypothetical protein